MNLLLRLKRCKSRAQLGVLTTSLVTNQVASHVGKTRENSTSKLDHNIIDELQNMAISIFPKKKKQTNRLPGVELKKRGLINVEMEKTEMAHLNTNCAAAVPTEID